MAQYRLFDLHIQASANTRGDKKIVTMIKRPGGSTIPVTQWLCGPAIDSNSFAELVGVVQALLIAELNRNGGIQHVLI